MQRFWKAARPAFSLLALSLLTSVRMFAAEITVFAAASLTDALKEAGLNFEKQSGDAVAFNFASSSTLARQIEEGAPADVFFSADEAKMDVLAKKGLIVKGTRRSRLSNALVIVVPSERGVAIKEPRDLASDRVRRIALAEPRTVPAGIYAKEFLEQQGLWDSIKAKVVPTENVRGALAAVESGNVEAGIVYKTDAAISPKVRIACEVSSEDGPKISYPAAMIRETKVPEAAAKFLRYLNSMEADKVFEKFGFIVLKQADER